MQLPRTGADLQQFLCAANWMRQSIPEYTRISAVLYDALERAAKVSGSRKKKMLAKVNLVDAAWGAQETAGFEDVRQALLRMAPLAHSSPSSEVCFYSDASQDTQLEPNEVQQPLEEQHHRPLAFLSGRFVGAAARWPTIEKEAFAIIESTHRLEYLLLRPKGYRLFTDHRNLVYIFDPFATDSAMARYQADKLQHWTMSLLVFRYVIEHVPGEVNAWGDLLSRWGAGPALKQERTSRRVARLAVVQRVSPLEDPEFVWPAETEILALQQVARDDNSDLQGAQVSSASFY
ncbi:hypothetical protein PF010_g24905 [Phytophthora fragariae]|uniref:Reverse transcriptase RNase H-like domain-containing protein n=1 Tax=Phytophthora fragariae TaxID=53985 RepID=A0A6G0K186_9STRA|nr:hypothetical protein PF010_g24905 [Phytophthora fragariae]KAE9241064.1 hypothetical protein PF004_g7218 [Phytophthora fragariae]